MTFIKAIDRLTRFRLAVVFLSMILVCGGTITNGGSLRAAESITAQQVHDDLQQHLEVNAHNMEKIEHLQKDVTELKGAKIDERMARLEAYQESNHSLLMWMAGAMGAIGLEATTRLLKISKK
jgi:hypothetical protein